MIVIDLIDPNSLFWHNDTLLDITYLGSTVYLAIAIIVGIILNSRALSLLNRANKVREIEFKITNSAINLFNFTKEGILEKCPFLFLSGS